MGSTTCSESDAFGRPDTVKRSSVPARRELDRLLVRATEAAIEAALNIADTKCPPEGKCVVDQSEQPVHHPKQPEQLERLSGQPEHQLEQPEHQLEQPESQSQQQPEQPKNPSNSNANNDELPLPAKKAKSPRTLKRRFCSLFGFVLGGGKSQPGSRPQSRASPPAKLPEWTTRGISFADVENGSNERRPCPRSSSTDKEDAKVLETLKCRRASACRCAFNSSHNSPQVIANASNTVSEGQEEGQLHSTEVSPQPESKSKPQPQTPEVKTEKSVGFKTRNLRGGPSTKPHKTAQDSFFRECRIVPVSTFYKKVALVPGRERLFLSTPSNPRMKPSPMLYDIAYENFRHHSDCNRDFTRCNLKKICSSYCVPSQFRYVQ